MPYVLGPDCGTLEVHTRKGGAAAKAGHNLRIEVGSWQATLDLGDAPSLTVTADPRSLRVLEGTGGVIPLGDDEKRAIPQTIDEEILRAAPIEFRSTLVVPNGDKVEVEGELELAGSRAPVAFELTVDGDHVTGSATVKQTNWGIKPYSALFGTLKVADEVEVALDATTRSESDA
jgi:YceI-like domain